MLSFINIRKVPTEVFANVNDKIKFDRYYCINSSKALQKRRQCLRPLFYNLSTFSNTCMLT